MNKLLLFLIGITLCLFVVCDSKCGSTDIFKCPDNSTCCQGPTGKICYKVKDGQCCEDLLTCCDANSVCDNENHKCVAKNPGDKNVLKFLGLDH
jgi:hypothetical protein